MAKCDIKHIGAAVASIALFTLASGCKSQRHILCDQRVCIHLTQGGTYFFTLRT